jgi:hypothetical protein
MKKILALLTAAILCVSLLASCGNSNGGSGAKPASGSVTVDETVLVDEKGVKAVLTGIGEFKNELLTLDDVLLIDVTNNTANTINFSLTECSVNGWMIDADYGYDIEAGKTMTFPGCFNETMRKTCGVTTFADFRFRVVIESQNGEDTETLIETDPISIKTSAAADFQYEYDESGTPVYDKDGVKIIAREVFDDEYLGKCVRFYVSNQSDRMISVNAINEAKINGKDTDVSLGADVAPGMHALAALCGFDELKDDITELTVSFEIYDFDTGDAIVEQTDPVTVTF